MIGVDIGMLNKHYRTCEWNVKRNWSHRQNVKHKRTEWIMDILERMQRCHKMIQGAQKGIRMVWIYCGSGGSVV